MSTHEHEHDHHHGDHDGHEHEGHEHACWRVEHEHDGEGVIDDVEDVELSERARRLRAGDGGAADGEGRHRSRRRAAPDSS